MLLHELPLDILFLLLEMLENNDIYNYLKAIGVSSAEQAIKVIPRDKNDWAFLFEVVTKERCLPFPSNLKSVDEADAQDIASWVLHSLALNYKYTNPDEKVRKEMLVRNIGIRQDLHVTWLKLILGRWCLIAASGNDESELSLWEIEADSQIRRSARIYLGAPVMDGQVEHKNGETRCAITVGAAEPYVLVLGLSRETPGNASFQQFAYVPGFSHVLFLRGDLVGVGVRNGDDTYPYIVDWKTGKKHCLAFPHTDPSINCPLPIEPCKAMAMKGGLAFALHVNTVHVFKLQNEGRSHPQRLAVLPISLPVADGYFLDGTFTRRRHVDATVCLMYQATCGAFQKATITINSKAPVFSMFSIEESTFDERFASKWTFHWCLGSSGTTLFCLNYPLSPEYGTDTSAAFASLGMTNGAHSFDYMQIPEDSLPVLDLISCVDFDDGNGLLLLNSAVGDVQLVSVLKESIISPEGTRGDLEICEQCTCGPARIYHEPKDLDLPLFYTIRKKYRLYSDLPDKIVRQVSAAWSDPTTGIMIIDGWSNDWSKFGRIWDWLVPLSRWGPLDQDFLDETLGAIVRHRLQSLGEIIPVLYRSDNHYEILFRIGQRLFFSRKRRKEEDRSDFEMNELGRLGVLPFSYDQFVAHPMEVVSSATIYNNQTNLSSWEGSRALDIRITIAYRGYETRGSSV